MIDFDALDARVEARLSALARRSGGGLSFGAGDEPDGVADLARLLDLARSPAPAASAPPSCARSGAR